MNDKDHANKIVVNKIDINGIKYTNKSLIRTYLETSLDADCPNDIEQFTRNLHNKLHEMSLLGIFKCVDVLIDSSKEAYASSGVVPVDITINLKERPRLFLKTGSEFSKNEANINASVLLRNVFGKAEMLEASLARGTRTNASFNLLFRKPIESSPFQSIDFSVHQHDQDWMDQSSFCNLERGLSLKWRRILNRYLEQELGLESQFRNLYSIHESASLHVREAAGYHFKNSIVHKLTFDCRDDKILPTDGVFLRIQSELAGLGFGDKFFKTEIDTQKHGKIWNDISLSLSFKAGFLFGFNLSNSNLQTPILDRFHLGGPWSIRGFQTRGIGPRSGAYGLRSDSLGGNAYIASGISIFSPIPGLEHWDSLRAQFFANIGSLVCGERGIMHGFSSNPISASIGTGLALKLSVCRLEFNIVWPVSRGSTDKLSSKPPLTSSFAETPRLQFGVGTEFL